MARCSTCGNKATPGVQIVTKSLTGIRTTKQTRTQTIKPIIRNIARSATMPIVTVSKKMADKGSSVNCPLCGQSLMAITQDRANKRTTFLQCVSSKCDYKRKA